MGVAHMRSGTVPNKGPSYHGCRVADAYFRTLLRVRLKFGVKRANFQGADVGATGEMVKGRLSVWRARCSAAL